MKIAIVLGKGVEGCGVTRCAIEFQKFYKDCEVFATIDKKWGRVTNELIYTPVRLADDSAYEDLYQKLEQFDTVMFYSIPSKKHPQACIDNFFNIIKRLQKPKLVAFHHDHSSKTLHDNADIKTYFTSVDLVITHSATGVLAKWMAKEGITVPLKEMGLVGFGFDETRKKYWKPIEETNPMEIRWIGRTAMWKGPDIMMDFHNAKLREMGYRTILEGLEASIQYALILYHDGHDATKPRDLHDYFRKNKIVVAKSGGSEEYGSAPYCYPPYVNGEALERMSRSGFSSNLYHLKAELYGKNIENCHAECASVGAVPIFHKHFGDSITHRVQGKPFTHCDNTGTVWLDEGDTWGSVAFVMEQLSKDPVMRDEWRNMAFEFWKQQANNEVIIGAIVDAVKTVMKWPKTFKPTLQGFFG